MLIDRGHGHAVYEEAKDFNDCAGSNFEQMDAAGLADVETYISEKYSERMELWAIE